MRMSELCRDCKFFEHDCNPGGCFESCMHPNKDIRDIFYDDEEEIKQCEGFEI